MRDVRTAEILAVGSELLTPHRIDTNSLFLTGRLNEIGIAVRAKAIVGDDREELAARVRAAVARVDLLILTGGLGPTDDDVTRPVVADVLGRALEEDAGILDHIRARFKQRGIPMPEINRRQAQVPRGAELLSNPNGTAPGLLMDDGRCLIALLPGPPREMQPMFDGHLAPRLQSGSGGRRLRRRVLKMTGRSESQVEEMAFPVYSQWRFGSLPIETTILASPGLIELHLSTAGGDPAALDRRLEDAVARLSEALGSIVFSTDGRALEVVVGDLLAARGRRIAAAESCTGGLLLGRLTDVPGSSAWVIGGVVAYADRVKIDALGVEPDLIAAHGAVSEPVAIAMATGVRSRFDADIGVAITGIAGPGGGRPEKPVGTVVVALASPEPTVRTFAFPGDREMVRRFSTTAALDMTRRALLELRSM